MTWPIHKILSYVAHSEIEPPPMWQAVGLICSVIANCHSTKRKFKPSDFVPGLNAAKDEPIELDFDKIETWQALFPKRKAK